MATATKTARTIRSSTTLTAGNTDNGTAVTLTSAFGGLVTAKVTNGATGPTIGCTAYFEVSVDNSAWKVVQAATAAVANSAVTEWGWDVPPSVMYARVRFTGNTAQSVTIEAFMHELTSIA